MTKDNHSRLIGIFCLAALLLNFPVLSIFGKEADWLGIPVLYAYIFLAWLFVIALILVNVRKKDSD